MAHEPSPPETLSGAASEFADTVASAPPLPDSGVPEFAASGGDDDGPDTQDEPTLSHIGRYALKRPLGVGGLGTVYEAWDPMLSRTVAVKTLQFAAESPLRASLDGLFLNEARAVAGLSHPHIVTVHDAGLSPQGVYIAMERLHGRDLRQALAKGWRPSPAAAAQLTRRVADALAYAHARGVIHCDIKPGNIFLSNKGKPTVLDFGIARVAHGAAVPALDGVVAGSPHYLAPEQLTGIAFDERADIYALGVVLYEMLTGRKAFSGDSLEQITNAVLHSQPAPAHVVQPAVPLALSAIAERAMARLPDERYASAHDMAAALRQWLDSRQAQRHTSSALRWRRTLAWGGGVAALLVLGAVGAPLLRDEPPAAALQAARPAPVEVTTPAAVEPAASVAVAAVEQASATPAPVPSTRAARPPAPAAAKPPRSAKPAPGEPTKPASLATGTVQLAVTPWGQIEVDGRPAGLTPPLSKLELSEGAHQITVRNGDNPPYTATIQVSPDRPAVVRHRFGS